MSAPVFLLSSERSGSNLIRVMLGSHPEFCAPHSPHIIKVFVPLLPNYGPLTANANLKALAADMVHIVSIQLRGWPFLPTADQVFKNCSEPSFAGLVNSLYGLAAKNEGKSRSFIKDNGNMQHAADISLLFPDARFVYLVRDARDVALSWKKSPGHPGGVKEAAKMWRTEQAFTLQFISMCPDPSRISVVHYEDLILSPEPELRRICKTIGATYNDAMLEFYKGNEAKTSAEAAIGWKNLTNPVMKNNLGKYLAELSVGEQKAIERIAGRQMLQLGYTPAQVHDLGASQSGTIAKLFRAGQAAIPQLLRGRAGVQELKKRAKRLAGMREIMIRAGKHNPEWNRAGQHTQDNASTDGTDGQDES